MYMYLSVSLSLYFCMSDLHLVGWSNFSEFIKLVGKYRHHMTKLSRKFLQKLALQHWQIVVSTRAKIVSYNSAKCYPQLPISIELDI